MTEFLKENNISVLLQRVHLRPNKSDEDYDLPYKLAKLLIDAGLTVALEASGYGAYELPKPPFLCWYNRWLWFE